LERNSLKVNEPRLVRNPSNSSEPKLIRNPFNSSESKEVRNPVERSEPNESRNPIKVSEPEYLRNPQYSSELCENRNPNYISEQFKAKIRNLVEIYYDVQDVRIRSFNRLRQVGKVVGVHPELLKKLEQEIRDYIKAAIKGLPIYEKYLKFIKGIGPILAGGLISYFDPYKAEHASSFWRYAGLHVENGKAPKRKHGKKLGYNPKAKVLCWKIGDSFIKQRTPFYREIYDKAKERENEKLNYPLENPKNCPFYKECKRKLKKAKAPACALHIHYRAMRKMVKRFLADFWAAWRSLEGLPVSEPYPIAILGHEKLETQVGRASHLPSETHHRRALPETAGHRILSHNSPSPFTNRPAVGSSKKERKEGCE